MSSNSLRENRFVKNLKTNSTIEPNEIILKLQVINNRQSTNNNNNESEKENVYKKRFVCNHCGKVLSNKTSLTDHVNIHLGIKPHECQDCGKKFRFKSYIPVHRKYCHTFEKPHKCDYCSYRAVEKTALTKHIRTHTNERPYCCSGCDYRSTQKSNVNKHFSRHTGEKFPCPACKKLYSSKQYAKNHTKICHEEKQTNNNGNRLNERRKSDIKIKETINDNYFSLLRSRLNQNISPIRSIRPSLSDTQELYKGLNTSSLSSPISSTPNTDILFSTNSTTNKPMSSTQSNVESKKTPSSSEGIKQNEKLLKESKNLIRNKLKDDMLLDLSQIEMNLSQQDLISNCDLNDDLLRSISLNSLFNVSLISNEQEKSNSQNKTKFSDSSSCSAKFFKYFFNDGNDSIRSEYF